MKDYLSELNEAQRAPVLQKDGAMMVIAGAGSGKTRVLTYRIAHLMQQGVDAFNILALTFTNKAAREMKDRIARIIGSNEAKNLWMGTFHSIFAKILRFEADKLGFPSNFTIYDQQDSQRLISSIIKELGLDKDIYKYKQVQSRISKYKNNLITVKEYLSNPALQEADQMAKQPRLGEIYALYVDRCFKAGAMDFDDLLLRTNELLYKFPEVLAKYQNRFRYILVDEYQDTNHSQYLIVKALSDRFQNICVVGDDAQSIYAFRGANINNIFNFQKDYKNVSIYRLEQNYRSTGNIVKAANSVIEHNKNRLEKNVWTANDSGSPIKIFCSEDDAEEGRFVASSIFEHKIRQQLKNHHFAILYRTNSQSRALEDALRKRDIPYRIYGGLSFYQRKEIKDVLAYLRLVINPNDEEALRRIINFPARGIGESTLDKLALAAHHYQCSIFDIIRHLSTSTIEELHLQSNTRKKLSDFYAMIEHFSIMSQQTDAYTLTEYIVRKTGMVLEMRKDATPEGIARLENIEEMLNGIKDFVEGQKEIDGSEGSLTEYLEDVALATDADKDDGNSDRVALMTIHLAKGLEFPYVYIVGMEENLFPSAMSIHSRTDLEEERRLFYVALTRGEKQVYLTYANRRYRWGKLTDGEPSRFIDEIDETATHHLNPRLNAIQRRFQPLHFDETPIDRSKLRLHKPTNGTPPSLRDKETLRKLKPVSSASGVRHTDENTALQVGMIVEHSRFGRGKVLQLEGIGNDRKAEIQFQVGGIKKLLLKFAKLSVIS